MNISLQWIFAYFYRKKILSWLVLVKSTCYQGNVVCCLIYQCHSLWRKYRHGSPSAGYMDYTSFNPARWRSSTWKKHFKLLLWVYKFNLHREVYFCVGFSISLMLQFEYIYRIVGDYSQWSASPSVVLNIFPILGRNWYLIFEVSDKFRGLWN